jgi:glycerol-3-phosphate acyltransferase PlsY
MVYALLVAALTAYFLGNLNGSVCISALVAHDDVRKHGSGNAGLTNFFRSYGGWSTLLVILVDMAKTVLAAYGAGWMLASFGYFREGLVLGAVFVSIGHDFPALLGFKGGKGILCGFTAALIMDWRIALVMLAVFVIAFAITRYVSLGSVLGALTCAVAFGIVYFGDWVYMAGGIFIGLLAIYMHRSNLARLLTGEEAKVHLIHKDLNK